MTRVMYDALEPNGIPLNIEAGALVAGYVDNTSVPDSYARMVKRFPNYRHVSISSHARNAAQVLDVERGAVDPSDRATIVNWVNQQLSGGGKPIIYANTSTWPQVRSYFTTPPQWWEANWNGQRVINPGTVGHQLAGEPGYDLSVMLDHIPGIDPAPRPDGDDMTPQDIYVILTQFFTDAKDPKVPHSGEGYALLVQAFTDALKANHLVK